MPTNHTTTPAHVTLRFQDLRWPQNKAVSHILDDANLIYTYNARGATWRLIHSLGHKNRRVVLLPAVHCPTIVLPVLQAGFQPLYYGIDENLNIIHEDLLNKLSPNVAAVVTVNFFGFPAALDPLVKPCRDAGVLLIEDCAHSFLYANPIRLTGERGDASIFSFRKLVPCGPGGAIRFNHNTPAIASPRNRSSISHSFRTLKARWEEALNNHGDGILNRGYFWLENVRTSAREIAQPPAIDNNFDVASTSGGDYRCETFHGTTRIPWLTHHLIRRARIMSAVEKRRGNYQLLSECLHESSRLKIISPNLPREVVPWAFPVLLDDRSTLDYRMREQGVPLFTHGETLHPSLTELSNQEPRMVKKARYISSRILCFGIHQNLDPNTIKTYSSVVNKFVT